MVLGANLKPSPAGQTPNIYVPTGTIKNINHTATFQKIAHGDNVDGAVEFNQDVLRTIFDLQETDRLVPPENAGVFEKFFVKKLQNTFQRYLYVRLFSIEHYESIFAKNEFDAEVFLAIV